MARQNTKINRPLKPKKLNNKQSLNANACFEDPHLARFFQQPDRFKLRNENVIVIEDIQDESDGQDIIGSVAATDCTSDEYSNDQDCQETITLNDFDNDSQISSKFDFDIKFNENDTYRVGNWVYCEFEPNQPFSIRKIEELKKKSDGTIEAKLRCAFRRCDIPSSLLGALEKRYSQYFTTPQTPTKQDDIQTDYLPLTNNLTPQEIYQLKQRELFYSKYIEIKSPFNVDCLRGKIELDLLVPDVNLCTDYIKMNQNKFFYQINYDQNQKRLSVDKIQIRVGSKYQAELPELLTKPSTDYETKETLVWNGERCRLSDEKLNSYINKVVSKQLKNNLTRDAITYKAIKRLHLNDYNDKKAKKTFSECNKNTLNEEEEINNIPVIWSQTEMDQFEEGITKCSRDFNQIQKKYLPNKNSQQIIEYYYNVWKRRSEHIKKREIKRMKKLNDKLDLLYIPNSSLTTLNEQSVKEYVDLEQESAQLMCISCQTKKNYKNFALKDSKQKNNRLKESLIDSIPETIIENLTRARLNQTNQFINAGIQSTNQLNSNDSVCNQCYLYWKKYGGYRTIQSENFLNNSERLNLQQRLNRANANRNQTFKCLIDDCGKEFKERVDFASHSMIAHCLILKKIMHPRPTYIQLHNFYFHATPLTRASRALVSSSIKKLARNPTNKKLNLTKLIRKEWNRQPRDIKPLEKPTSIRKQSIEEIIDRLTNDLNTKKKHKKSKKTGYIEFWRPLTPISCITGDDEDRKKESLKSNLENSTTFLSPSLSTSSSVHSNKNSLRRRDSSSSESICKKMKTNSAKLVNEDSCSSICSSQNSLNISSDTSVDYVENKTTQKKPKKEVKQKQSNRLKNKELKSKSKNFKNSNYLSSNLNETNKNQFEPSNLNEKKAKLNEEQPNSDCKENKSVGTMTGTQILIDEFCFISNRQLRQKLKGAISKRTLTRLRHSPFLQLRSHLYQKTKC